MKRAAGVFRMWIRRVSDWRGRACAVSSETAPGIAGGGCDALAGVDALAAFPRTAQSRRKQQDANSRQRFLPLRISRATLRIACRTSGRMPCRRTAFGSSRYCGVSASDAPRFRFSPPPPRPALRKREAPRRLRQRRGAVRARQTIFGEADLDCGWPWYYSHHQRTGGVTFWQPEPYRPILPQRAFFQPLAASFPAHPEPPRA